MKLSDVDVKDLAQSVKDDMSSWLDDVSGEHLDTVHQAISDVTLNSTNALLDPLNAARYQQNVNHAMNTLESVVALKQMQAAKKLRKTVSDVMFKVVGTVLSAVI